MDIQTIRDALTALVAGLRPAAPMIKTDSRKPVVRPSFRIDVYPVAGGAACRDAREREVEVDIWYYPQDTDHPRDECDALADDLLAALDDGFEAGGVWISLDENAECDMTQDALVVQFAADWVESAAEEGEYMETLEINQKEAE